MVVFVAALVVAGLVGHFGDDSLVYIILFVAVLTGAITVPLQKRGLRASAFALAVGTLFVRYVLPAFAV